MFPKSLRLQSYKIWQCDENAVLSIHCQQDPLWYSCKSHWRIQQQLLLQTCQAPEVARLFSHHSVHHPAAATRVSLQSDTVERTQILCECPVDVVNYVRPSATNSPHNPIYFGHSIGFGVNTGLILVSIWQRVHRKMFGRGGPVKKKKTWKWLDKPSVHRIQNDQTDFLLPV